ncbi:hypothetical protein G3N30_11630 [Microbacterium lacticum]|uniref:hypothetical protein n=1 Tax=Microbacterium lacticum TaxID=33885 RepID=UPI0018B0DFE4|nr:hypothetical protein [Microbacterium lacticum]MBF9336839.1 hypothetical protein [Microbacterium lacticum]
MSHRDHQPKSKQHAHRRDVHRRYPLWVYDDDDWQKMRDLPVGDLICPKPGCRAELVPVERQGTRFLRNRPGTSDCGHAFARGQGGGPPSPEHRWLQQRLVMLCDDLGYEAMQEHAYADVWVKNTPPLAIEVQRWATNFAVRSAARQAMGANVLWLLPESASSKKAGQDLFRHPAARLRVLKRGSRTEEAKPWEPGHSGRVVLWIGATVMRPSRDGLTLVSAGNYDAREFLREVLSGERRWYGPSEPGFKFGAGWAKTADVEQMRTRRADDPRPRESPHILGAVSPAPVSAEPVPVEDRNVPNLHPGAEAAALVPVTDPDALALAVPQLPSLDSGAEQRHPFLPTAVLPPTRRPWLQRLRAWLTKGNTQ